MVTQKGRWQKFSSSPLMRSTRKIMAFLDHRKHCNMLASKFCGSVTVQAGGTGVYSSRETMDCNTA